MPTFIKTGFWDKLSRAPKEYLNLDLLLSTVLPSQLGNNGKYLQTDGATASWQTISLTGYVPYTGATQAVNLGAYDLTVNSLTVGRGNNAYINNTVLGSQAGAAFTTAQTNVAIGEQALKVHSTGNANTAVGRYAMLSDVDGASNTALGASALVFLATGVNTGNTAIGVNGLSRLTSGSYNTWLGYTIGTAGILTSGSFNTIIGAQINVGVASLSNNIILADGAGNIKYRWDGTTNTITGDLAVTGVLRPTVTTNRQIASYILAIADRGKLVEMNVAIANNLTIPLDSTVSFPIGTQLEVAQYGAGQTTIVGAVGVTIRSASGNLKIASQYVAISLIKIGTNEWYCFGNLSA